jgi:hypothetical protein
VNLVFWVWNIERAFHEQFRSTDGELVFRRNGKAPPVRVSRNEADRAIALFRRRYRIIKPYGMSILALATVVAAIMGWMERYYWYACIGAGVVQMIIHPWVWRSTPREWDQRAPIGPARADKEVFVERVAGWPWAGVLILGAFGVLVLIDGAMSRELDPLSRAGWLIVGGLSAIVGITTAIAKWRTRWLARMMTLSEIYR